MAGESLWKNRIVGQGTRDPNDLIANPLNWRRHPDYQRKALEGALNEIGWIQDVIVNQQTGNIIDGHLRVDLALSRQEPLVPVKFVDLSPEEEKVALTVLDSITGLADTDNTALQALLEQLDVQDASLLGFLKDLEAEQLDEYSQAESRGKLAERFLAPPLSILDARAGYWRDRKQAWVSLGLRSEDGRNPHMIFNKDGKDHHELAPSTRKIVERGHSTSIFDPVLAEILIAWFSPKGARVLDPFAGGSVRGLVAGFLGREYLGIDLRPEQIAANEAQRSKIPTEVPPEWVAGDSAQLADLVAGDFDFILSCPPYGDLEKYSEDPRDLSRMKHEAFLESYRAIIAAACAKLKPDRFAAWVVGDFRDKKGHYRNFVADSIDAFRDAGMQLYNEAILITQNGSAQLRASFAFDKGRKLVKVHQNVLIFVKGDWRAAHEAVGTVEFMDPEAYLRETGGLDDEA